MQDLGGYEYESLCQFVHGMEREERSRVQTAAKKALGKDKTVESSEFVRFKEIMEGVQEETGDAAVKWVLK